MPTLYHYGRVQDIAAIMAEGLTKGYAFGRDGRRVHGVWLTRNPMFSAQTWAPDDDGIQPKVEARYTVTIPDLLPQLVPWARAREVFDPQWVGIKNLEHQGTDDWFFYDGIVQSSWLRDVVLRSSPPTAPKSHWGRGKPDSKGIFEAAMFPTGDIQAGDEYPDALREAAPLLYTHPTDLGVSLLARHVAGDWGDVPESLAEKNRRGLATGSRVMSAYRLPTGRIVVVMTLLGAGMTMIEMGESLGLGQSPEVFQRWLQSARTHVDNKPGHTLDGRMDDFEGMLHDLRSRFPA